MLAMRLDNMIDSCVMGTDPIIAITNLDTHGRVNDVQYYNVDNYPVKYEDFPVNYMEMVKQFDGKTALIFTVYVNCYGRPEDDEDVYC